MKKFIFSFAILLLLTVLILPGCRKDDLNYARVTKVVVTEFPATRPDGTPWDMGTAADIYIRFVDLPAGSSNTNIIVYEYPDYIATANPFDSHAFDLAAFPDVFLLPGVEYRFALRDEDPPLGTKTNTESMGSINFTIPESKSNDDPSNPILLSGDGISVEIYVEYVY